MKYVVTVQKLENALTVQKRNTQNSDRPGKYVGFSRTGNLSWILKISQKASIPVVFIRHIYITNRQERKYFY